MEYIFYLKTKIIVWKRTFNLINRHTIILMVNYLILFCRYLSISLLEKWFLLYASVSQTVTRETIFLKSNYWILKRHEWEIHQQTTKQWII